MTEQSPDQQIQDEPLDRAGATPFVVILGVVGIILGLLLLCGGALSFMGSYFAAMGQQGQETADQQRMMELQEEMQNDPTIKMITYLGGSLSLLLGISMLIASIGIFRLRAWAWKLTVCTASVLLVWLVISTIIDRVIIAPRMEPLMDEMLSLQPFDEMPPDQLKITRLVMTWARSLGGICCCSPFPLLLLIGLLVPGTRKQFFPTGGEPTDFPQAPTEP
ncbi:MAG: hypothetical protein O6952_09465 [Planctomycetota bacterium]|nr:hypothetical protein [Planctomycetota bacterium]